MRFAILFVMALILLFGCTGGSKYGTTEKGPSAGAAGAGTGSEYVGVNGGTSSGGPGAETSGSAGGSGSGTGGNLGSPGSGASGTGGSGSGTAVENVFRIPVSGITTQAKVYSEKFGLKEVKFFAVKGSDGKVHVAFDACDVCGGRYGYRQEGDDMVCNKCGKHFKINEIGTQNTPGGCSPSYLSYEIKGNDVVISGAELGKGAFRF